MSLQMNTCANPTCGGSHFLRTTGAALAALWLAAIGTAADAPSTVAPSTAASPAYYRYVGVVNGTADRAPSCFSSDGREFSTADDDVARVWDAKTRKPITDPLRQPSLAFQGLSADGKTAFTANDLEVRAWDVATSKLKSSTRVTPIQLLSVDISPDGTKYAVVGISDKQQTTLWDVGEAHPRFSLDGSAISAEFNPAGNVLVVNFHRKEFQLRSTDTGRSLCAPIPSDDVYFAPHRACFTRDGRDLLVPQNHGFMVVDASTGKVITEVTLGGPVLTGRIHFTPDDKGVIFTDALPISSDAAPVRIYDAVTGKLVRQFGSNMDDCQIAPGGKLALCSRWLAAPELWDLSVPRKVQEFPITGEYVARLGPDGSTILLCSRRGPTRVWRARQTIPATSP